MAEYGEWNSKGATLSDATAHKEYGVSRDFIINKEISNTKKTLEKQCKDYQSKFGYFAGREFLGVTRHRDYVNVIWKQKMSKSRNEYTAIPSLVQEGNRYLVDRCWVDLWEPKEANKSLNRTLSGDSPRAG